MTLGSKIGCAITAVLAAGPVSALDLSLPSTARLTVEATTELGQYDAPIGVYASSGLPVVTVEGRVERKAWRVSTAGLTPLQLLVPLRAQLEDMGYETVFDCAARECGGFDFRFATEVLPSPNMYVDLSQFHHLTALNGPADAPREAVGILVSVADASAYVQIIHVDTTATPASGSKPAVDADEPSERADPTPVASPSLQSQLRDEGRVILSDLEFASGTSDLGPGPYPSLSELAQVLLSESDMRIALVGHTDTVGALDANIALSRARARSVRTRLIEAYGVAAQQMDAEGMGYLAPVASNLTAEGREANRRVEAVLLSVR